MKFENIKSDGMRFEYKVLLTAEEIEDQIVKAVEERAKTFKMQGFRPGNVPINIVRSHVENSVMKDVFDVLISNACENIIKENGAKELSSKPTYRFESEYEKGKGLDVVVTIEAAPSFELKPYEIELTKVSPLVNQEEIDAVRADMMKFSPLREKADANHAINNMDEVFYKAICFVNNAESKKKTFEDTVVIPESVPEDAEFLQGFIGKKIKESFDFTPATDKTLKYKIVIKSIKKAVKDVSSEDFAVKSGFKDLADLNDAIRKSLEAEIDQAAFLYHKNQILDALAAQYSFELPQGVVDLEMKNIIASVKKELKEEKEKGTASEEDLKKTDDDFRNEYKDVVNKRVLLGYVLNKIAKENNISASDKEVQNIIMEEIRRSPSIANQLIDFYSKNESAVAYKRAEIVEYKVVSFLVSKAKATEISKTKKEVDEMVSKLLED